MKKALLAASAVLTIAGSAHAADLKAPVYKATAPAPAYSWAGFYLGVNAGIGAGQNPTTLHLPTQLSFSSFNLAPIGAIGGVQAGYNWQFGNWVLGVEADIQASGQKDNDNCVLQCVPPALQFATFDQKLSWFGTVRGRIGYATGSVMTYYTGGFVYGDVKTSIAETITPFSTAVSFSEPATGWTLGAGVEAGLGGNWTGKVEYLYLDLGSSGIAYAFPAVAPVGHVASTDFRNHVFRAGLNYRIGGHPATASLAPANWTGLYVGGNLGSGIGRTESGLTFGAPVVFSAERFVLTPRGFLGGVQAGYNWQAANWVFGIEADFQGSTQKDDDTCVLLCLSPPTLNARYEQTMPWFGTVRGRIGYSAGSALFYLTGGLAYGKIETDIVEQIGGAVGAFSFSETKVGWTIGGGIERPLDFFGLLPFGDNWTVKGEYLYVDLGSSTHTYTHATFPHTFSTEANSHIFRTGVNYHFNAGPMVAKY